MKIFSWFLGDYEIKSYFCRYISNKKCMIMANDNNIQPMADDSQIVLYQPDESISLQVKIEEVVFWAITLSPLFF